MASITDVVKEGLKYPFNDGKKVLTLGIIFLVSSLVSLAMEFLVFDNMRILANIAPVDTVQAALSAMPPSNMALIVLSWIVTFILMVFASGYIYDVIKYGIEGRSELPEFSDIKGLLVKGLRAFVVGLVYSILPMILFFLGLMLTVNESVGASVNAIGGIVLLIAIIFAIFVSLVNVMALCNMMDDNKIEGEKILMLDEIQDPGNLGTIIRTAESFGCKGIFVSKNSVDIYGDKVVRSTMGAIFNIPVIQECDIVNLIELMKQKQINTCAFSLDTDNVLSDFKFKNYN